MSYSSIAPCTAVVRVQSKVNDIHNVWSGLWCHCGKLYTRSHATRLPSCVNCESATVVNIINLA